MFLKNYYTSSVFLFVILSTFLRLNAQPENRASGSMIIGHVYEVNSNVPMEFANIVIFNFADSSQVTGTVTNKQGLFQLDGIKPGTYYIKISFIGFETKSIDRIQVKSNSKIDVGKIYIAAKSLSVNEVVVSGQRSPITYEIDKKVINVGENFSEISGTAVDILENVPSINVDIEGNVSLRGSGSFTVLIDGRPSVLDANETLQQIPASAIENIEIITNPSAKYDPEGTAGIINIIMKKNKNAGISGVATLNAGLKDKYGGELIADYKTDSYQINLGVDYNNRDFSGTDSERNWTNDGTKTSFYNSEGSSIRSRKSSGFRGSLSLDLGDKNNLTFGARYGDRSFGGTSFSNYSQWTSLNADKAYYISSSESNRGGTFGSVFANYKKEFETKGHQLTAELFLSSRNSDESSTTKLLNNSAIIDGKITTEAGPETDFRSKIDYTLPVGANGKFEAGYQGEIESSKEVTSLSSWLSNDQEFYKDPLFSNDTHYNTKAIALYSLFADKISNIGYQIGFRTEYTGRQIEIPERNNEFKIDRWDYFPSLHVSYDIFENHQLMASYTRRINRPHGWELEPFQTWTDAYNVRVGNPGLLPEYIDSYELGYQTLLGSTVASFETYYRITNNRIEHVSSVYAQNVTLQSTQNIGKDYSLGAELFFNFDPLQNWNVNLMGNLYDYQIEGMLNGASLDRKSFNWSFRFNNTLKISELTQVQFNLMYHSPSISSQGRSEGHVATNIAVKQELFDKFLTATLQVRDVFRTSKHESVMESFDFYRYSFSQHESPIVMLNLRFNINNYKNGDRNNEDNSGEGEEM
jgi:outer membrane receptor protein involved in Fe transport